MFFVLTGLLFIGSIKSDFIKNALFNYLKFISIFVYSKILIDECTKDESLIKLIVRSLKIGCISSLVFLITQLIIGTNFTFYSELNLNIYAELGGQALRYPSFFQDPQKYAQYLSMASFLFLINTENKSTPGIINIALFLLVIVAIFMTGSRAAFSGFIMGLLIILLSRKSKIWIIAIFCCLFGYLIMSYFSKYFSLFNRTEDYVTSYELRSEIWKENLQIFFANPLLGIGIGNHHYYILKHSSVGYYLIDNEMIFYGTENGYLQVLIEFGIFGFLFVLFFILAPIINAFRSYLHSRNFNIILLIASVISWMIAFTTVTSIEDKRILVVLVTIICLLIVSKNSPKSIYA